MMKRFVFAFVSMAAAGLMAAPNAALVPESADVVMTVDGLNVSDKEAEKVWQEELTKLGFEVPSKDPMKSLEEIAPGLSEPVAVLLGYSKESQTISATSLTAFIDLLPQVNKEKEPEGKLVLFLEQPKANLDALQKAMEAFVAKQEEKPFAVVRKGAWLQLKDADEEEEEFLGITVDKGGYSIVLASSEGLAEGYRKGEYKAVTKAHPLQKAFAKAAANQQVAQVMLYQVAKQMKSYMAESDFEAMTMQVPFIAQLNNVLVKTEGSGDRGALTLTLDFATAETAQEVAEMLIGYKAMATGMLLPMAMGTPESKTGAFVKKIRVSANDASVVITLTGTRDEIVGILKEVKEVQERQQAAAKMKHQEATIEGLDELFDEMEEDTMTPEEAESILDCID